MSDARQGDVGLTGCIPCEFSGKVNNNSSD